MQACGHFVVTPNLMTKAKKPYQMAVMHPLPRVNEIRYCLHFTLIIHDELYMAILFVYCYSESAYVCKYLGVYFDDQLTWRFHIDYHTVTRQCVHCCKGDAASQWEMAILGCQNSVTPERSTKNLMQVITSVSWPRMPNFIKFGGTRTSRQYGEMYTSHTFFYIFFTDFRDLLVSSTEKILKNFKRLMAKMFYSR